MLSAKFSALCQSDSILYYVTIMQKLESTSNQLRVGKKLTVHLYVLHVLQYSFQFVTNWCEIVLGAREAEGIDFWWLDWQQGESWINIPLINPTIWLNYIFFTNPYHWKNNTVRLSVIFMVQYFTNHI